MSPELQLILSSLPRNRGRDGIRHASVVSPHTLSQCLRRRGLRPANDSHFLQVVIAWPRYPPDQPSQGTSGGVCHLVPESECWCLLSSPCTQERAVGIPVYCVSRG